jgi:hypothetical protein
VSQSKIQKRDLSELAEQRRRDKALKHEKVLKLHRDGLPPALIAVRLRMCEGNIASIIRASGERPVRKRDGGTYLFGDPA